MSPLHQENKTRAERDQTPLRNESDAHMGDPQEVQDLVEAWK